jgi:Zn-finger nucleic acid-binding protein
VICEACGAALPAAFPGATVTCVCGRPSSVPGASPSPSRRDTPAPGSGLAGARSPYRDGAAAGELPRTTICPYCSNECPALVRICPHCDVRLDNVRCARCFTLQPPGAFACARCGDALELEPLLDATDAPCPRCMTPLEVAASNDSRMHECPRCGGLFTRRDALAEILVRAETGGSMAAAPPRSRALEEVRYLPCPLCHIPMNRVNFGKVSGVIVDVCKKHGTWFDAGELTRVVAFAASGGLERTRERERQEKKAEIAHAREVHTQLASMTTRQDVERRLIDWEQFLIDVFLW